MTETTENAVVQRLAESIHEDVQQALAALLWEDDELAYSLLSKAIQTKHALWELLEPSVRSLGSRFRRDAGRHCLLEPDDMTQEAFLKFRKSIGRWQPARRVPVLGFLWKVLNRHFIDLDRRQRRRGTVSVTLEVASPVDPTAGAPIAKIEVEDVLASLLPDDPRRELKLRAFRRYCLEGATLAELRDESGSSTTTLHKWIRETKTAVRAAVGVG